MARAASSATASASGSCRATTPSGWSCRPATASRWRAYTEIKEGRGTPNGGVWLDVSHLPRETIMRRLPRVYQTLLELQMLDITTTPIEVAPTAHYSMGGVWVRPEDHGTGVEGLYAIGEASSGLHGANRLGGNSLIELLVFGRIVGEAAAAYSARLDAAAALRDRAVGGTRRDRRRCSPPTGRRTSGPCSARSATP